MATNRRLEKRARRLMGRARVLSRQRGETAHLYGETQYAAKKWARKRRVIIKAEVVRHPGRAPKNNPRFVVTNLTTRPQTVYEVYCQRGDVEKRLKELHHGLEMDRTSCSKFRANQFCVLLALAAYILFQEVRRRATRTAWADAHVGRKRDRRTPWNAHTRPGSRTQTPEMSNDFPLQHLPRRSCRMLLRSAFSTQRRNALMTVRAPSTPMGGTRIGRPTPASRNAASCSRQRAIGPSRHTASSRRSLKALPPTPFSISAASAAKPLARKSRWKKGKVV